MFLKKFTILFTELFILCFEIELYPVIGSSSCQFSIFFLNLLLKQNTSLQTLQRQVQEKDAELARVRANYDTSLQQQIQEKDAELARVRANYKMELNESQSSLPVLLHTVCVLWLVFQ